MYIHKIIPQGHISGIVIGRVAYIQSLYIDNMYRNRNFGTMLLHWFLNKSFNENAIHVELDDCSSNYRKSNNIYIKNGFYYANNEHKIMANIRQTIKKMNTVNSFLHIRS